MQSTTEFPASQEDKIQRFAAMCTVKRLESRAWEGAASILGIDISGPPVGNDPTRPLGYDPFVTIPEFKTVYWVCLSREIARCGEDLAFLASIIRTMDSDYQADVAEALKLIEQHAARQTGGAA